MVYRFADADKQRAWEESAERAAWLARADEFARQTGTTHVSGLETWFALPGRTAPAPPKWKMAVVTFRRDLPSGAAGQRGAGAADGGLALAVRPLAFAGVLVPLMTWIVMPRLTRLLRRWLYPR